jgi:hypothetical protein
MRTAFFVASRELRERRLVFLGALIIGILTLATPLLPHGRTLGSSPGEVVTGYALWLSLGFALAGAFLAGLSVMSRDLVENRIGFYFSRPISAGALWSGKVVAALLLAIGTAFLVVLPATVIGGGLWQITALALSMGWEQQSGAVVLAAALGAVVFLIVFGQYTGIIFRSRSRWLALDLLGIPFLVVLFWLALAPLLRGLALQLVAASIVAGAIWMTFALLLGGFVGLGVGRVDLRSVHRALTITVAGLVASFVAGFALWGVWVRSPEPSDLTGGTRATDRIHSVVPLDGDRWVAFGGKARGRGDFIPFFLSDLESGRSFRLGAGTRTPFGFSADGTRAYWGELASVDPFRWQLMTSSLEGDFSPRRTTITMTPPEVAALSPDGSRLAVIDQGVISIYDIESERSLLSMRLPDQNVSYRLHYLASDLVRIFALRVHSGTGPGRAGHRVYELEISSRQIRFLGPMRGTGFHVSSRHDLIILRHPVTEVLRGSDLESILEIDARSSGVLPDGDLVFGVIENGSAHLRFFSSEGEPSRSIGLGPARNVVLGGLDGNDRLFVLTFSVDPAEGRLLLVDPRSAEVRSVGERLVPERSWSWFEADLPNQRLFSDFSEGRQRLVTFDPATGEKTLVAGRL